MTSTDDLLDQILLQIGDVGRQQIIVLCCLVLVVLLHSTTHIAYVFTSMDSDYRCLIPECENVTGTEWLKNAIPFKTDTKPFKCEMYEYFSNSTTSINNNINECSSNNFNVDKVKHCTSLLFKDNDFYIGREFDLLCEENLWALSLVGSFNTFGMFLGLIITGFISDKYGRKRLLLFGMSGCGIVGLIKTLSPSFHWFLAFELIEAIFSAGTCCCVFIMGVELVIPKRRALMGTILNTSYSLGEVLVALVAWYCKSWRLLIYYTYTPCVLLILLYWKLPESLRWMLSKGKIEESKEALRKIAKINKRKITEETLNKLDRIIDKNEAPRNKFLDILKSKCLVFRFCNCCFGWLTCAFLFYGITLNSVSLNGNKYLDFILISLTELPAYWCCNFMMDRLGRRSSICLAYSITAIACLCFIFSVNFSAWFSLFVYCLGKFGATAAFYVIYVITSEIFPTTLRHTVMGLCSTVGRFGSMTSPQTPLLSQIWDPLPLIMFAALSGIAGTLSLFLPETKGIKLPDTIEEAEKIQ